MPDIRIPKYFSQLDGDSSPYSGTCAETVLKMMDHYLTGREISISDIVKNGDKDGSNTTLAGMRQAAQWLGFDLTYKDNVREDDIKKWLAEGKLILAVIKYSLWENKYKQDLSYPGGHAILITGMTDDGKAIRFADPYFKDGKIKGIYDGKRWDGWMENNKWASYGDFYKASYHNDKGICLNGTVMVCTKVKETPKPPTPPAPPTDPCAQLKAENTALRATISELQKTIKSIKKLAQDIQNM